ncbi:hypothetical protein [Ornithinibacillus californiensis]|uniref:hypothetical protein n=1 Tax=Ornithinibacillus californiensis TaxID=161536 RepID=UPI00064DACB1|nr:hypothetical protein [Ornithinibacillus californiensis]
MRRAIVGLWSGLSLAIVSFILALGMFWLCFYILNVRLHSYIGSPTEDVVIYFNYMVIILGFFFSIGIARYIHKTYSNDIIKTTIFISLTNSIIVVISSWLLVNYYDNTDLFHKIFPPLTERYPLPFGTDKGMGYYSIYGIYLFLIQVIIGYIVGKIKSKE